MHNQWSEPKIFKFLQFYKQHECLWNRFSPEHDNARKKTAAFRQILSDMNVPGLTVKECLDHIKFIRTTYQDEQQRLKNLQLLGGHSSSKLLWYPIMHSMLMQMIRDEKNLNTNLKASVDSESTVRYPSTDESPGKTTPSSGYVPQTIAHSRSLNRPRQKRTIRTTKSTSPKDFNVDVAPSSARSYLNDGNGYCFSIFDDKQEHPNHHHPSNDVINFHPKTSYNYKNGILEINSAIRIPVSSNCDYSRIMGTLTPQTPGEYNVNLNLTQPSTNERNATTRRFCIREPQRTMTVNLPANVNRDEIIVSPNDSLRDTDHTGKNLAREKCTCPNMNAKMNNSKKIINDVLLKYIDPTNSNVEKSLENVLKSPDLTNESCHTVMDDVHETKEIPVVESKSSSTCTITRNLAKIVVDFINVALNESGDDVISSEDRQILMKVSKKLQPVVNKKSVVSSKETKSEHVRIIENSAAKSKKKVCWSEPIEEIVEAGEKSQRCECKESFGRRYTIEVEDGRSKNSTSGRFEETEARFIYALADKITTIIQDTVREGGYGIEKDDFFSRKNLITNGNGEVNHKIIDNELMWQKELRDLLSNLQKTKQFGKSISFTIKTLVLPQESDCNRNSGNSQMRSSKNTDS